MPVSDLKVLKKMQSELNRAVQNAHDASVMKSHIRSVRMLADLFLDEESSTNEELVLANMKEEKAVVHQPTQPIKKESTIDHDDANGTSIFDF